MGELEGFANALGINNAPQSTGKSYFSDSEINNLIGTESSNKPYAINKDTKAMGYGQFTPETLAMLHQQGIKIDPFDKESAVNGVKTYLNSLVEKTGSKENALKAYGGFVTKDPSSYINKVLGNQKQQEPQSSGAIDLTGFQQALQGKLAPEQLKSQMEAKNPSDKSMLESAIVGVGKPFYSSVGALGQLAGKGLQAVGAEETGKGVEQLATQFSKRVERAAKPFEEANPKTYTGGEIAGYLVNPVNKLVPGGSATTMMGAVGQGALQGAAVNALTTPVTDENKSFLMEKGKQLVTGGVAGGVGGALGKGLSSLAQPVENQLTNIGQQNVKILRDAGIPVDVAQATGSTVLQRQKAALMDNPFTAGKEEQFLATQKAAYNRAIAKTMGEDATAITPEVIQSAKDRLGNIYDNVASRNNIHFDKTMNSSLKDIEEEASQVLNPEQFNTVKRQIDNILAKADANGGALHGEQYQSIKRVLDKISGGKDTDIGGYARDLKEALLDGLSRSAKETGNDADVALLKQANKQYSNMKKIEDVVLKNPQGDVSPSLLSNSLATKSKRYSIYQDDPELANLARAGKDILEQKLPNSGTIARFLAQNPVIAGARALHGKVAQGVMNNPTTAQYLEQGIQNPALRGLLELPQKAGNLVPPYAAKPGIAGTTALKELIRLRNQ